MPSFPATNLFLSITNFDQSFPFGKSIYKSRSQAPVLKLSEMCLKHRINAIHRLVHTRITISDGSRWPRYQHISRFIWPIQTQSCSIWHDKIVKHNRWLLLDAGIAQARKWKIVEPVWMRSKELRWSWSNPIRQKLIVFTCWFDDPT